MGRPERPPLALLAAVALAMMVLPLRSMLGGGEVGGYRMFTRLAHLELRLDARGPDGEIAQVEREELRPHLGPDAFRIVGAALARSGAGDAAEGALRAALPDLARICCELDADRTEVTATLRIERTEVPPEELTSVFRCH